MNRKDDFETLKDTLVLVHSRYNWGGKKFNFEGGKLDESSLDQDRRQMIALRQEWNWTLKKDSKIFPSMENLALCVQTARIVYGHYRWDSYRFNFTNELTGNPEEIIEKLKDDFERLYKYRHNDEFFKRVTANNRVLSTLEGLMFQTITSVRPFSVKRATDYNRYNRVMRCLEGILFQLIITINPAFTAKKS